MISLRSLAAIALLALALGPAADAQSVTMTGPGGRSGRATVVSVAPTIDGRLDDEAWQQATVFTDFVQREPVEGNPVSERTEVRIVTDGVALYVAAWLYDREAALIVPSETIRDVTLTNSDYFAFILDTYHDRQNGFLFGTTPSGIEHDAQVIREGEGGGVFVAGQSRAQAGSLGGVNLNWDANWTVRTSRDGEGWYAEFRVPFSTLRYGGGATQTWGLNLMRGIRRRNEEALWSRVSRQFSINRLSQAGTLEDLAVPAQRIATVTPYVLGNSARNYTTQSAFRGTGEFGVDAKYGITPSLTLDLTYNTDFAQVEVDEQRTNLTRFPLFFPEKRPFFLENAGVLSAGTPQAVDLFFTRRIGIDSLGQPVPILGGGRLTGRVGGLTVGALAMVTDAQNGVEGNGYGVLRLLRELSTRSRVGVMAVQRQRRGDGGDFNRVLGVDARVGIGQDWTADAWAGHSETPGLTGDPYSWSGRVAYETRDWRHSVRVLQVGDAFNPEVGFMARPAGYRFDELMLMRLVRNPSWRHVREWNPHISLRRYVGTDGFLQSSWAHIDVTEVQFNGGGRFGPDINVYTEGLQVPFEIAPGVILQPGQYAFSVPGLDWGSDPSDAISFLARLEAGQFYSGTKTGGNVAITARRGAAFSSTLTLDHQDVDLPEGDFVRDLIGLKLAYFFTPRIFVQSLTQYNNQAEVFTANVRLGWLSTANTGLFVVLNDGEEAEGFTRWRRPLARSVTVKYSYQVGAAR
ncbi:MAG: carbohydrate binding family 9 domain-containing protein [Gemmatimonadaceae bacterium]|nr:carbohydrate binding family 9 domain-containing protein [Gemmatimonadaceae bacterium]